MRIYSVEAWREGEDGTKAWVQVDTAPTLDWAADLAEMVEAAEGAVMRVMCDGRLMYPIDGSLEVKMETGGRT